MPYPPDRDITAPLSREEEARAMQLVAADARKALRRSQPDSVKYSQAELDKTWAIRDHKIRRGDRFIHRRFIKPGVTVAEVKADPDNEEFYEVREVTKVQGGRFWHRAVDWQSGEADFSVQISAPEVSVRRWLP